VERRGFAFRRRDHAGERTAATCVPRDASETEEFATRLLLHQAQVAVSLAAQIATTPIITMSFEEVSVIGVLINLVAVLFSGPILTLGLLETLAGKLVASLAYLINVSNGFLTTVLVWVAQAASGLPIAVVATPGAMLPLVELFYLGCVPAAVAEATLPEERWPRVAGLLVLWTAL
jgi:predicted membrane metal-binding protein